MSMTVGRTVSHVLQELKGNVNEFIDKEIKAISGHTCPIIEAASDVMLAIDNAHTAWQDSGALSQEIGKVNAVVTKQINELKGLLDDLQSKKLTNIYFRVIEFINSLSLASWQPQMTGLSRRYAYIQNETVNPSLLGVFPGAEQTQKGCHLQSSRHSIEFKNATETTLSFKISNVERPHEQKICQFIPATLRVRYNAGYGFWSKYRVATYDVWIGTFPISPGNIVLSKKVEKFIKTEKQHSRSMNLSLSRKDFAPGITITKEVTIGPTPGWRFASPLKVVCGNLHFGLEAVNNSVIVQLCLTQRDEQVNAHVEFDEERDVFEEIEEKEEVRLKWGTTSLMFKAKTFQLIFDSYDGKHFEFNGPDKTHPYLKIWKFENDNYTIGAEIPR